MRLATIETWAGPRAALLAGDSFIDIHATEAHLPGNLRQILAGGPAMLQAVAELGNRPNAVKQPVSQAKYHAPIIDPQKIICVGAKIKEEERAAGGPRH